jgi:hypothetical protein
MGGLAAETTTVNHTQSGQAHQLVTGGGGGWLVSASTFTGVGQVESRTTPVGVREYGWDEVSGRLTLQKFTRVTGSRAAARGVWW